MPTLDWTLSREHGVTLVELTLRAAEACEVRVASTLTPVWPPRIEGVPAAGWDGDAVTCAVGAGETVALGYATPAEPTEPPAEVVAVRDPGDDAGDAGAVEPAADVPGVDDDGPAGVLRALGDPRPPRDAVAVPKPGTLAERAWLDRVEVRVAAGERLAGADDLVALGDALAAVGGLDGAERLAARLESDAGALADRGGRAGALGARAAAVDLPLSALRRLA